MNNVDIIEYKYSSVKFFVGSTELLIGGCGKSCSKIILGIVVNCRSEMKATNRKRVREQGSQCAKHINYRQSNKKHSVSAVPIFGGRGES